MAEVTVRSTGGLQQEIVTGGQVWYADEPIDAGGGDTGPNPYELLLGALGACKAMTVLLYARRKKWDLQAVQVDLSNERAYGRDCEECDEHPARMERISVRMRFEGALDETQRQRLKEIAGRCPVHQTLIGRIDIVDVD